ncbi:MAG: hypothetical protein MR894_06100, partial [Akkermansia muciniphila]|nr:hypothetical protein [Akkermansia muciniphila]
RENPISDEGHNQRAVPISEATGIHLQELSRSAGSRGVVIKTDGVPKKLTSAPSARGKSAMGAANTVMLP